ncbi:hypothetical protein H072_1658 [Dactylellina haptotyla CBS 200.50]|uniref:NmrA-like domain-containing protein n=1 Tax=Dactylellina haptotyla (strain CBS 200.50) TaxID=1284197 RepID=S8C9Q4_DACHA|nr:hypothetical protein H072_1658 [Dactylellina haptotyla CBS 200.50]
MTKLPTIAVAGGTGALGKELVGALLDPRFRCKYADVIILTRNANTPEISKWKDQGASAREYSADDEKGIFDALAGVDALINVVASRDGGFKSKLAAAVSSPSSTIKVYIPSEFGVDHYLHDFQHPEWDKKKSHFESVNKREDLTVSRVFPGLFLEHSIGPWYGLNTKEGKYEIVGSGDTPISFTSISDIGRAVASALANIPLDDFPEKLYFSGDSVSLRQISELMKQAGAGEIEVSSLDLAEYKAKTLATTGLDPASYLRFLMADGKIDNKGDNSNEVVNPGEKLWKWKKMKDHAAETGGRPWAD